jgi:hypothetical protein
MLLVPLATLAIHLPKNKALDFSQTSVTKTGKLHKDITLAYFPNMLISKSIPMETETGAELKTYETPTCGMDR